jgi:hypothetical protein
MKDAGGHGSDKRGATPSPATVNALRANVRAGTTQHYHAGLRAAVNTVMGQSNPTVARMLKMLGPVTEPPEVTFSRMGRDAELGAVARVKSMQTGEAFR